MTNTCHPWPLGLVLPGLACLAWACGEVGPTEVRSGLEEDRSAAATPVEDADAPFSMPGLIGRTLQVHTGDLDAMLERRRVRVLVPFAPPYFFFDQDGPHGVSYEMFRELGTFLEKREGLRRGEVTITYVPCELDAALPWLQEGYGDIAAGGLTITAERSEAVAFSDPLVEDISEIIVAARDAAPLASLEELAGREIWVTAGSSYAEHLRELSAELVGRGRAPIAVREAPQTLATHDVLEMVHAGILELTACDAYKARLWAGVLDRLVLREDLVVHAGGVIAAAVRSDNPDLLEALNAFVPEARKGSLLGNILIERYFGSTVWIEDPAVLGRSERIDQYVAWMRELGDEHGFDWRRIAAQCFQESALDPNAESSAGAIGLMQLLPATARDMGCEDPYDAQENLRAGVRYLAWLRSNYFSDPELDDVERIDFILAAYNAGPGNVRRWRSEAAARGLDPDRWRDHVERIALERVGVQPVRYVNNIEKYFVAYSLAYDLARERAQQLDGQKAHD